MERFLNKVWRMVNGSHAPGTGDVDLGPLHRAVASVGADLQAMRFNTAIATLMELVAWARRNRDGMSSGDWTTVSRTIVLLLAPLAPHIAEELWSRVGGSYSVHRQPWPAHDALALIADEVTLVIQVDGRTRDRVRVRAGMDRDEAVAQALTRANVRRHLGPADPKRVVFVPDRLINLVSGRYA
jgi:leucyl-tRNA synthetase